MAIANNKKLGYIAVAMHPIVKDPLHGYVRQEFEKWQ